MVEFVRLDSSFDLEVIDIDTDPTLQQVYTNEIPLVLINGHKAFKYRVDADQLRRRVESRGFWTLLKSWGTP